MCELKQRVAARFVEVNGDHPMSPADDAYVDKYFVTLETLCADRVETPEEIRAHMLAGRLPLPSYLRSDGAEMVPADLLDLADRAGGVARLGAWFLLQWTDRDRADEEWESYLSGRYVCLRAVRPDTIDRKDGLTSAITEELAAPRPGAADWLTRLHDLVDSLESLELPFTRYDRLRFGGPTSRDTLIDGVRARFPLTGQAGADPGPLAVAC